MTDRQHDNPIQINSFVQGVWYVVAITVLALVTLVVTLAVFFGLIVVGIYTVKFTVYPISEQFARALLLPWLLICGVVTLGVEHVIFERGSKVIKND